MTSTYVSQPVKIVEQQRVTTGGIFSWTCTWVDLVHFDINNKQRQRRKQVTYIHLSDITSTYVSANASLGKLPKFTLICFVRKSLALWSVFSRVNRHKKSKEFSTWFHIATFSKLHCFNFLERIRSGLPAIDRSTFQVHQWDVRLYTNNIMPKLIQAENRIK